MVVSAAKAALSMLPILTILIIMLVLRWSSARAGVIGLIVTILVAWLGFGYGSDVYPDLGHCPVGGVDGIGTCSFSMSTDFSERGFMDENHCF